jgi:hypothetical protein
MPIADMLINNSFGHWIISFLDGNAGYNQIFMAEEDMSRTTFRYPDFIGLFEWVVMTFGLKNTDATYQRTMNLIFYDLLGIVLEIYIDDVVVKSDSMDNHLTDLRIALERMHRYGLKMNSLKCAFEVSAGKFLGFIIHEHGIEIDPIKIESINKVQPPQCKNDMQKFLGKLNYLRRFIFNLSGKISAFAPILWLKNEAEYTWGLISNTAGDESTYGRDPISAIHRCRRCCDWGCFDTNNGGKEHIITYFSRCLIDAETRYSFIEKLCLSLFYACSKLWHYLLGSTCVVVCQADVIKYMLQQPILSG